MESTEKGRTAVTDGEGRYNVVNLPPGTYTVTFTLAGFNVYKREGNLRVALAVIRTADLRQMPGERSLRHSR